MRRSPGKRCSALRPATVPEPYTELTCKISALPPVSFPEAAFIAARNHSNAAGTHLNQSAFQSLVKAYSAELYRYAYWLCRDRFVAEDLIQETFARAWSARGGLRDE